MVLLPFFFGGEGKRTFPLSLSADSKRLQVSFISNLTSKFTHAKPPKKLFCSVLYRAHSSIYKLFQESWRQHVSKFKHVENFVESTVLGNPHLIISNLAVLPEGFL